MPAYGLVLLVRIIERREQSSIPYGLNFVFQTLLTKVALFMNLCCAACALVPTGLTQSTLFGVRLVYTTRNAKFQIINVFIRPFVAMPHIHYTLLQRQFHYQKALCVSHHQQFVFVLSISQMLYRGGHLYTCCLSPSSSAD